MTPAPKAPLLIAAEFMKRPDVWARIGLCALTAVILFIVMFGWNPPFAYRLRRAPIRDLHALTTFEYEDYKATDEQRTKKRQDFLCLYTHDVELLKDMRNQLIEDVFKIKDKEFGEIEESNVWSNFFPVDANDSAETAADEESFNLFRDAIAEDEKLQAFQAAIKKAFIEIDKHGLLTDLPHKDIVGSLTEIEVHPVGNLQDRERVSVSQVRIAEVTDELRERLQDEFGKETEFIKNDELVARHVFDWLKRNLEPTLSWNDTISKLEADEEAKQVPIVMKKFLPGDLLEQQDVRHFDLRGIKAGVPLDADDIRLLRREHEALVEAESWGVKTIRSTMFFGLFAAIFSMFCQYLYYRDRNLLDDLKQFSILLGLMLVTLTLAWVISLQVAWRAEIVPVTVFAMTVAIVYHIELAMLLATLVSLAFTVAHGFGLGEFVVLTAAATSASLMCRSIRSRTKLVNIGMIVAAIVFPTVIGVNYLLGQPLGWPLVTDALWFAGGAGVAGLVMTALLPFLERLFDIQTDISLLELSDANHPLLKELVQRAAGTYNHSINVASMSEAAADAIGANGLLCRVGAYFHDVGKLRKPEYFIENQAGGPNKHDDLVPTMSTLVILAHVKDGIEIAKKHHLPQRIIDLIEQHHGTTLVEYFYQKALQQSEELNGDEDAPPLDESDFRYPGPRPQTPEAAVMMLADTVESASRALREPAPARIEGLVREITRKRFDDGQFEECNITIQQLNTIQESLIKSLNAMYHARVKYPEQQPA